MRQSGVFREIVVPEWLVYADKGFEDKGTFSLESLLTVTFVEHGGKTNLALRHVFESAAHRAVIMQMGYEEGMGQSLERLEEHLAKT